MPTNKEFSELISKVYHFYDVVNGVEGVRFRSSNGYSIFLPFRGYSSCVDGSIRQKDWGYYWASTLSSRYEVNANRLAITRKEDVNNDIFIKVGEMLRCNRLPVRAVTDCSDNTGDDSGIGNDSGNKDYEKPDIGLYDFTATTKSLKVQYKIYNKDKTKVTSAKIYYGISSNPTSSKTATVSGILITANISGLKTGTTYYVKCVATGKGGTTTTTTTKCITNY